MSSKYVVGSSTSSQLNIVDPQYSYRASGKRTKRLKYAMIVFVALLAAALIAVIVLATYLADEIDKNNAAAIVQETTMTTTVEMSTATTTPPKITDDIFLPKSLKPYLYQIQIKPNMYEGPAENFTFDGTVTIQMMCIAETTNVTLHTESSLTIDKTTVKVNKIAVVGDVSVSVITRDDTRDFTIFHLDEQLVVGDNYSISMAFSGPLKKDARGFYRSDYVEDGKVRYTASTQFQPTDARKAFPCFDEPDLRAQFDVKIVRDKNYISLGNMARTNTSEMDGDYVVDTFERTVVMPTYLVAFFVGDFQKLEQNTDKNVLVRTWARRDMVNKTQHALGVAVNVTEYFEWYMDTNYSLSKQDHVGVSYFSAGAMENWGLIKYREEYLAFRPDDDDQWLYYFIALIVNHEIAHMWFGNLVTCKWWNDIWLNEGFATYFEDVGHQHTHPEWEPFSLRVSEVIQGAMAADGALTSRAVVAEAYTNQEIRNLFNRYFTYYKGSCIVQLFHFILGDDVFMKALKAYLDKHAYGSVETKDLWNVLEEEFSGMSDIMDPWVMQNNYPVVKIERNSNGFLTLTQRRFLDHPSLYNQTDTSNTSTEHKWSIPFTFTTDIDRNFNKTNKDIVWFYASNASIFIDNSTGTPISDGWVIGNPGVKVYYRVNYDNATWYQLINVLNSNHEIIHVTNRAQLLSDAWTLAQAGMLDIAIPLRLSGYIGGEREFMPWSSLSRELYFIERMFRFSKYNDALHAYILNKTSDALLHFGYNNTGSSLLETNLRSLLMEFDCKAGSRECISNVMRFFDSWRKSNISVDPDLRYTTYCTAVQEGGEEEWLWLKEQYGRVDHPDDKDRIIWGLSCTKHYWLIMEYIDIIMNEKYFDSGDREYGLIYLSDNRHARSLVFEAVFSNWDDLLKKTDFSLGSIIYGITDSFNTEADKAKIQAVLDLNLDLGNTKGELEYALSLVDSRMEWMRDYGVPIGEFISGNEGYSTLKQPFTDGSAFTTSYPEQEISRQKIYASESRRHKMKTYRPM